MEVVMNHISQSKFSSIEQMTGQFLKNQGSDKKQSVGSNQVSFQEILTTKTSSFEEGLKFSKHANQRLASRNIDLSDEQLQRLESAINRAREKGMKESLVLVDNLAFIVNVKNNLVVTAVNDAEKSVFTNIDGAVIN